MLNFDGNGNISAQQLANSKGPLISLTGTYHVSSDGSVTLVFSNGGVLNGMLSADGNVLTFADTDYSDSYP